MGIETLFEGQELSEEFKTKVATVFEAAVVEAVAAKQQELDEQVEELTEQAEAYGEFLQEKAEEYGEFLQEQAQAYGEYVAEQYEEQLEEASAAYEQFVTQYVNETMVEKVDQFLDYVADQWMTENKLAVERGLKAQMSESFLEGLQALFAEHYIEVPESKHDIAEEMAVRLESMEERLNATLEENMQMRKFIRESAKQEVVDELCEGLADTQAERLNIIAEGIEFNDIESFRKKLEVVRGTMVVEGVSPRPAIQESKKQAAILNESAGEMGSLIAELTRLATKK